MFKPPAAASPTLFLRIVLFGLWLGHALASPAQLQAGWYSDCMLCEKHLGGNSKIGPFSSKDECQSWIQAKLSTYPYRECYSEGGDSDEGAAASSGSSLQDSTTKALSYGIAHGDSETFGMGLLGLGTMAVLNSGNSGPSAAELAARRRADQERAAEYAAAQALKQKKFDQDKSEMLDDLDSHSRGQATNESTANDQDELKDVPLSPRPNKKWKAPHLKPVANPLQKATLPEDIGSENLFETWDQAKAFARANGGTIAREGSGKIAWCGEGFPYHCSGRCYSEAALDDFRIPCSSTLKTTKPED